MPKIRQVRHYHLPAEHHDMPHDELAHELIEAAKGGQTVHLQLPSGEPLMVHPADDHDAVHQRVQDARGKVTDAASRKRGAPRDD